MTEYGPLRHLLPASVGPVSSGDTGTQLHILKGVLFENKRRQKPIQPFREKEVKFDGTAAVANDELPPLSPFRRWLFPVICIAGLDDAGINDVGLIDAEDAVEQNGHRGRPEQP